MSRGVGVLLAAALVAAGCSGGGSAPTADGGSTAAPTPVDDGPASVDTTSPPADPAPTVAPTTTTVGPTPDDDSRPVVVDGTVAPDPVEDPPDPADDLPEPAEPTDVEEPAAVATTVPSVAASEPECAEGPADPAEATSEFLWVGRGVRGTDGALACLPEWAGGWQEHCVEHGCFRLQTFADHWPDGTWDEPSIYRGYERAVHDDAVDFAALPPLHRAARWAAGGTVSVTGGRCGARWDTWSPPVTGFFVAEDLVVTAREGTAPAGAYAWGEWTEDCERRRDDRGPFVRTFDGEWATGRVVASDQRFAVIRLERVSPDGEGPSSTWAPWSEHTSTISVLPLGDPDLSAPRELATVHHPHASRFDGAWHVTTGSTDPACGPGFYEEVADGEMVVLDLYADDGSRGAPVVDESGFVVGVLTDWTARDEPSLCGRDVPDPVTYSTLGPVSTLRGSDGYVAGFVPAPLVRALVAEGGGNAGTTATVADTVRWPLDAPIPNRARLEVTDWGSGAFTESGFPLARLGDGATFDAARRATLILRYTGDCFDCDPDRRSADFTEVWINCTGFAVTHWLVITNAHCVDGQEPGTRAAFRTYTGQDVEAVLVNHTYRTEEQEDGYHGDVALFRSTHELDVVPARLADSAALRRFDPVFTVGHPSIAADYGPFTTVVGSFIATGDYMQTYVLPSSPGASGSPVFDLTGAIIGQVAEGSSYRSAEEVDIAFFEYGLEVTRIGTGPEVHVVPRPFEASDAPVVKGGEATRGATANYIRRKVEEWAPGELPD